MTAISGDIVVFMICNTIRLAVGLRGHQRQAVYWYSVTQKPFPSGSESTVHVDVWVS